MINRYDDSDKIDDIHHYESMIFLLTFFNYWEQEMINFDISV